jgi:hypothetical protein
MNELNQTPARPPDDPDDLTKINGITKDTAQALNNLGIYGFADLLKYSPESLAERLSPIITHINPKFINRHDWFGQAQKLIGSHQKKETNIRPFQHWRKLADFHICFGYPESKKQLHTGIYHCQVGKGKKWEDVATEQLVNWMLSQANLPRPAEAERPTKAELPTQPPPSQPVAEETIHLELSDLWVLPVEEAVLTGGHGGPTLLRAKGRLDLAGLMAPDLTSQQIPFVVEFHLVHTQTNQSKQVASYHGQLKFGEPSYEIQQDFPIPPAGRYQLYVVASLLSPDAVPLHLQGPVIRVEP